MTNKVMGYVCLMFAGMNTWFMFAAYPSAWWVLHAVGSVYFTYRTIWWFDRDKVPSDLTVEQLEEVKEASELARQMLAGGKDKKEVSEWLNARLNLIRAKGQSTETSQSE